ncbi:MAG: PEPxxWA-CTERM sorting domain-containing protein [Pseudomonadota bacterium]
MRSFTTLATLSAALLTMSAPAAATTTVFAETDDTWNVSGGPFADGPAQIVTDIPGSWGSAVPGTAWISTTTNGRNTTPGPYTFTKVFDLANASSFNVLTATWKSDNFIADLFLNGTSLGAFTDFNQFGNVGPFSRTFDLGAVGASFQETDNTLQVIVQQRDLGNNNGNDMGLSGRFAAAVPEPATWMFMIFGFGAVGFAMRRQQKAKTRFQFA